MTVAAAAQRDCALYRIYVLDPHTNYTTVTLGYIGETAREPFVRLMEHLFGARGEPGKSWADTIVGWEVDLRVFGSKAEVLAAEEAAVRAEQPLYNVEYNGDNPRRVPPWEQVEQRRARDAAAADGGSGRRAASRPVANGRRSRRAPRASRPVARPVRQAATAATVRRWSAKKVGLAVVWLVLSAALCWTVVDRVGVRDGAGLGAAGATAVFVAAWSARRSRR